MDKSKKSFPKRLLFFVVFYCLFNGLSGPKAYANSSFQADTEIQKSFSNSFDYAEMLLKKGEFQKAIKRYKKALDLVSESENNKAIIMCYMRLGLLFWNIGELEESTKYYMNALDLAESEGEEECLYESEKALEIYKLYSDGKEYRSSGNYKKSIETFERAIEIAREIGSREHEAKCLRQLSVNYLETNDLEEFYSKNLIAIDLARRLNHKKEECQCLNNIGIYHWERNEYSKALYLYFDSLRISRIINNSVMESICTNNIGLLYRSIGDYEKAISHFRKALAIDIEIGKKSAISVDLNNIGAAYTMRAVLDNNKTDFYKALNFFKDCIDLVSEAENNRVEVGVLNNIGFVYLNLERYSESLIYLSMALDKAKKIKDLESMGMIYCNLGNYNQSIGDIENAKILYTEAEKISKNIKASNILWEAYYGMGKCCEEQNKKNSAIEYYEKSIKEIASVRSSLILDAFKAGFVRDKIQVYENLVSLLFEEEQKSTKNTRERFFNVVEKAKARAFLEVLSEYRMSVYENVRIELRIEERKILDKISSLLHILTDSSLTEEKRSSIQQEYDQAESEYMLLISKMRSEIPEVADMIHPEPCHLDQVQNQLLDDKTAVVEYFLGEKKSYLMLIEKNNSYLYDLPSRNEIKKSIKGFIKEISDPPTRKYRGSMASTRLYTELLKPIDEVLPESVDNLIIVPDGFLYFLPFEALCSDEDNMFMVEKYVISYAPSCSSLLFLKEKGTKKNHPKSLLAIGDPKYNMEKMSVSGPKTTSMVLKEIYDSQGFDFSPIPYSRKEIKNIAKLFLKSQRDIYVGKNAKEEVIKKAPLKDYKIIHFACHSLLDEKFPFRSALVLAIDDNNKEDGFLMVREIYNLRLSADMIVLSACQTGRGKLENVEGVLGLPRIFFYSGARSVVSSLWKINDKSTTQFMSYFYKFISTGESFSQALRSAKLKMIKSKYSHPFYWASFVLYGEGSS